MEYGVLNSVWRTGRIKGVWSDEFRMKYREDYRGME